MSKPVRFLLVSLLASFTAIGLSSLNQHVSAQGAGGSGTSGDLAPNNPTPPPVMVDPPTVSEAITITPTVIPVGKWPEGIAYDGRYLWVAESGSRRIAKVDPNRRRIVKRVSVGRLPVNMMSLPDGRILSLVHTDKKIWQQPTKRGKGRTLARIGDCPISMTGDSAAIWVVTYVNCTGDKSKVFKINPRNGKTVRRFDLQDGPFEITSNHKAVFVISTFRQDSTLTGINKSTGEVRRKDLPGARYHHIRATSNHLVAAGAVGDAGIVASVIRPGGARADLPRPIAALTMTDNHVVAIDDSGVIFVLAAADLTLLREISTTYGNFRPQTALIVGNRLYITTHTGQGQNGSVLVVDGWQP